ncbi:RNA polymerase sigma factor [Crateriforma conspicua]|uniref:ECF RNA polymerase sigma-E factor n=1 Tax=Crateriforma conspicua TaxID=2527996 RepID=A0A5C5YA58_9PLAN|nr:RNA polymerase sigma factor [Crateriforma conspicua]QDV65805.1 ECF RNA polymerase sigma-E factor [Crateriforma conspicua]TWT71205.1 ECF RNA polymerase sigma-E factor [Crateriforma conspicua]
MSTAETNAALARRACSDRAALSQLLVRHQSVVFQACFRWLQHRQDAEDVTQETFARAAKYIDRFDPDKPFGPWLLSIATNRCRTWLSKQSRQPAMSALADANCPVGQPDTVLLREELHLALRQLPVKQREAFELFHEHGIGYDEIARRLRCPTGTAKTWVHRARRAMMQHLRNRDVTPAIRPDEPVTPAVAPTPSFVSETQP